MPYCVEGTVLSSPHSLFCLIFLKAFLFASLDLLSILPTCSVPRTAALWCTAVLSSGEYCQEISGHRHLFPWIPIRSLQAKCMHPLLEPTDPSRHPFQQLPTLGSPGCLFPSFASSARGSNSSPLCLALSCWSP